MAYGALETSKLTRELTWYLVLQARGLVEKNWWRKGNGQGQKENQKRGKGKGKGKVRRDETFDCEGAMEGDREGIGKNENGSMNESMRVRMKVKVRVRVKTKTKKDGRDFARFGSVRVVCL